MTPEPLDDAARFGRLWDELASGATPIESTDPEFLLAIRALEAAAQTPAPPSDLAEQTWAKITGEPLPLIPYEAVSVPSMNGHYAETKVSTRKAPIASGQAKWLAEAYRQLAIAALSGIAGGFLAGIWARLAMRVAGFFTVDRHRGLLTENDAAVGHITFGGTLFIGLLGAAAGVVAGLLYVAIRRWLPGRGWQRSLGYGALLLAVFGFVVMDKSNPDYQLFGPAWLNVGSFSLAYIVMGFAVGQIAEKLEPRIPKSAALGRSRRNVVAGILMAPFAIVGLLGIAGIVMGTSGIGALVMIMIASAWLPFVRPNWTIRLPAILQQPSIFAYATLAVPSLIGLVLTLRAIVAIAGG